MVAERQEGFDQAISIRMLYNPPGVASNRSRAIRQKEDSAVLPMTANPNARTGDWPIAVLGETSVKGRVVVSTQLETLKIIEPYFDIQIPTLTVQQGKPTELNIKLSHRTPFEGEVELELVRLPAGVSAEKMKVTVDDKTATFALSIDPQAKVGVHKGLGCRIRLSVAGEPVIYTQGYAEVRIDPAPTPKPAATAGSPDSAEEKAS